MLISIIGYKRLIILGVLVGVNAVLAGILYGYLQPSNMQLDSQLSGLVSTISSRQTETEKLRQDYTLVVEQKAGFEQLQAQGFMSDQNRLSFRRRVAEIQQYTGVLEAAYDIDAGQAEANADAQTAKHSVLVSAVKMSINSMDDVDFFNFLFWIENGFPGQTMIDKVTLQRDTDVTEDVLKSISISGPVALTKGEIEFKWRTLVGEDTIATPDSAGAANGG